MKILWLSPTLNHYKVRFLNKLQNDHPIEITVLAGIGRIGTGDVEVNNEAKFQLNQLSVLKKDFGISTKVRLELKRCFQDFDWVMIPKEDKNLPLFLYAMALRRRAARNGYEVRLVSYNHPIVLEGPNRAGFLKRLISKFYYANYDRVIFYTRKSCERMVRSKLIDADKAFWANNTIDTDQVAQNYSFCYPDQTRPTILFIGRLMPRKQVGLCIDYYRKLKTRTDLSGKLKLLVIGDGPESEVVKEAAEKDPNIQWMGALVDEQHIAPHMTKASLVLVLGHSGLSINHAFAYGRPFLTFGNIHQPPEIDYVEAENAGFLLGSDEQKNLDSIASILINFDPALYDRAYKAGVQFSVENWCTQIFKALNA